MSVINNYKLVDSGVWSGRVDDLIDRDAFRIHQVIRVIDLLSSAIDVDGDKRNICLLGFCCDEGVKRNLGRPGAANGPRSIRKELANLPVTFPDSVEIYDAGNIYCENKNMEEAQENLSLAVSKILQYGMFPLVLGGGHETAYGHFNGLIDWYNRQGKKNDAPAIINFDAHLDMRPFDKGGSSGTMFYQIADKCKNENRPYSYLCLGTQTYGNTISLFKRADELGAKYIHAKDMKEPQYPDVVGNIFQFLDGKEHVYLTICSDVFNSANAPGVSALQPFGLDPEVGLKFIKQILQTGKVIGFDIAEVSPRFDHDNHTAKLAAVIIFAVINTLKTIL